VYTRNQPGLHELFAELRAFVDRYPGDRVLLGEFYVPVEELVGVYGTRSPELHLPQNLTLSYSKWQPGVIGRAIAEYQSRVSGRGWPTTTLDTHDQLRIVARAGLRQARVAALLLLTQRGTPTVYYGDEIGMRGVAIPPEQAVDPQGRRTGRNRDPTRTPMQWSNEPQAGFSTVEPWLPVGLDRDVANVASQSRDAGSLLTLYRRLLELRAAGSLGRRLMKVGEIMRKIIAQRLTEAKRDQPHFYLTIDCELDALLKLRQVCCDPRLVKLPSVKKSAAGSAKLVRRMERR